jgi:phenylacetate-CoA ligase
MSAQSTAFNDVKTGHAATCSASNDNFKRPVGGHKCPSRSHPNRLEFWESELTRPAYSGVSSQTAQYLDKALDRYFGPCMQHPFLSTAEIRERQFSRVRELVEIAYRDIPVYREKYRASGFSPAALRNWEDIQKIPVITKPELIAAFPERCLNPRYRQDDLFPTRSSGSSGQTLLIRVDAEAIVTDTIQGVRQFALQSGLRYGPDDLLAHVYTVPWWFSSIGNAFHTAFISNLIPPAQVAQHLGALSPRIISCYPSNLEALVSYCEMFKSSLCLAVTHSEHSSPSARQDWAQRLGAPVLDEYSSEEATRIALEFPCGHYHICEDTVHLDVLDPVTLRPQARGQSGLAIVTNLLNEAMPFIRYVQGDYVTQPANAAPCGIHWSQLSSVDGRANDAFLNQSGRVVPAGSILDITYRWMFDSDIHLQQFELVQKRPDFVVARFVPGRGASEQNVSKSVQHLEELLALCLEHPVRVKAEIVTSLSLKAVKHRPIRREIAA